MVKTVARIGMAVLALAVLVGLPADAGRPVSIKAELVTDCANCQTPNGTLGRYSVLPDNSLGYEDGNGVQSEILNHNSVYTLDTMDTLVNGVVGGGTRYVELDFYSPVEGQFPGHVLPQCWQGDYSQLQAVNWSVFAGNQNQFTQMEQGQLYDGWARMDFNVRNGVCDRQIYRYYLRWYNACIERTSATTWEVTSGPCGAMLNYGEANLQGQGGRKKETVDYGDWRLPFKLLLSVQ
jgi:hypothetical protein